VSTDPQPTTSPPSPARAPTACACELYRVVSSDPLRRPQRPKSTQAPPARECEAPRESVSEDLTAGSFAIATIVARAEACVTATLSPRKVDRRDGAPRPYRFTDTFAFSSSNQFWTRIISVAGLGFAVSFIAIKNRRPSGEMSQVLIGAMPEGLVSLNNR
jgi:hypothetical protein